MPTCRRALKPYGIAQQETTLPTIANYYTVEGMIVADDVAGTRTDYLADSSGSVVATASQTASIVNTFVYKPFGELLATGAKRQPPFLWLGTWGYRKERGKGADVYVRTRHYGTSFGQWSSVDPLWPWEPPYTYAMQNPTTYADPSGLAPCKLFASPTENPASTPECGNRNGGYEFTDRGRTPGLYKRDLTSLAGTVYTPGCCNRVAGHWYTMYIGTAEEKWGGTNQECGVEFAWQAVKNKDGWMGFISPWKGKGDPNDHTGDQNIGGNWNHFEVPGLGANMAVKVHMEWMTKSKQTGWRCTINETLNPGGPPKNPRRKDVRVQLAFGGKFAPNSDTNWGHSRIEWGRGPTVDGAGIAGLELSICNYCEDEFSTTWPSAYRHPCEPGFDACLICQVGGGGAPPCDYCDS